MRGVSSNLGMLLKAVLLPLQGQTPDVFASPEGRQDSASKSLMAWSAGAVGANSAGCESLCRSLCLHVVGLVKVVAPEHEHAKP